MNIYISGINGTGMGPLALMATDAGLTVQGSDRLEGAITPELLKRNIQVKIGPQDGKYLEKLLQTQKIDWFVNTSALPADHPELVLAQKNGIKTSKRDELIAFLLEKLNLKMIAIAGTHGKTTTTSMIIWACEQLGIPISYLVGTTLPFGSAGKYQKDAKYFVYEADEYDRNFLHFHPYLSVITSVSYDHPDIYPTEEDYQSAFAQFANQSEYVISDAKLPNVPPAKIQSATPDNSSADTSPNSSAGTSSAATTGATIPPTDTTALTLAGSVRRYDAILAMLAVKQMSPDTPTHSIIDVLNDFPGVGRRFERITTGVYSDYAHHPEEVKAAVETALEQAERLHLEGVIAVYQPHQNTRQHSIRQGYKDVFKGVDKLYWLPTYLTREDPNLPVLTPQELIDGLENPELGVAAEADDRLAEQLRQARKDGFLILLMTAGPADLWFRSVFEND